MAVSSFLNHFRRRNLSLLTTLMIQRRGNVSMLILTTLWPSSPVYQLGEGNTALLLSYARRRTSYKQEIFK